MTSRWGWRNRWFVPPDRGVTAEDLRCVLHEAWDPLPVPPPHELFRRKLLRPGWDADELDALANLGGKKWDEVYAGLDLAWIGFHRGYYYGSDLLFALEDENLGAISTFGRENIGALQSRFLRTMEPFTAEQRRAIVITMDWVYQQMDDITRRNLKFYRRLRTRRGWDFD